MSLVFLAKCLSQLDNVVIGSISMQLASLKLSTLYNSLYISCRPLILRPSATKCIMVPYLVWAVPLHLRHATRATDSQIHTQSLIFAFNFYDIDLGDIAFQF